jgi:2-dehydro-3-deoxy-D-gluconate 5-dehydrogenase
MKRSRDSARSGVIVLDELFSLAGRVALVTGGNGGLGLAMALGLTRVGARVAVTGRNETKNREARKALGSTSVVLTADVTDEDSVAAAITSVVDHFGRLDVLVNNAGGFAGARVTELSLTDWRKVIDSHLTGAFLCAKHAAVRMRQQGTGGKVINIGSMYSLFGPPNFANYAAAKSGVLGLTRALAVELAPDRICVNAVLPGWFETDLTRGMPTSELGDYIRRKTPAGRWGVGEDLIGPVVFLASSASDFVTGAVLPVDGGYSITDRLATPDA